MIPVGITSGRIHPLGQEDTSTENHENGGSRRRRRAHGQGIEQFLGMSGQDLEEASRFNLIALQELTHELVDDNGGNEAFFIGP